MKRSENVAPQDATAEHAERFQRDGYVVLEGVLPVELVDRVRVEYERLLEAKIRRFALARATADPANGEARVLNDFLPEGGNHDRNRWNMHLPSALPFFDERLIANPAVVSLLDRILAPGWLIYLIASDTPYPGAGFQSVHQDFSRLSIAVNIPLVDVTDDMGPIEVWPRTHRPDPDGPAAAYSKEPFFLPPEKLRTILQTVPSRRLLLQRGSILVRDHRLGHRGTANLAERARPMLSIYCVEPHPVPHRWLADTAARGALAARRTGRGRGPRVQHPRLFNLGNVLGRVVEETSLSDRDHRRVIPAGLWDGLSPRTRELLRYASVERGARTAPPPAGSLRGDWELAGQWWGNVYEVLRSDLLGQPRRPDHQAPRGKARPGEGTR